MTPTSPDLGGLRPTRQRRAVIEAVSELGVFAGAQSVHDVLAARGDHVGLSTVYRNLQALAELGLIDAVRGQDGEILYRKCIEEPHHYHLVCRRCGRAVELLGGDIDRWIERLAKPLGYIDVKTVVELYGICPECRRDVESDRL